MTTKDRLTVRQMAEKLGISRQAVLKAIDADRIEAELINTGPVPFYLIHKKEAKKLK